MRRIAGFARALAAALTAALLMSPSAATEERASLPDLEDEVMCPICGTTLELSEAPQAERERALIRELVAEGRSKEEIKDALVAEYGEEVLALPDEEGFDLVAWLAPAIAVLAAAVLFGAALLRRRPDGDADRGKAPTIDPAEAARLREDMASHDG